MQFSNPAVVNEIKHSLRTKDKKVAITWTGVLQKLFTTTKYADEEKRIHINKETKYIFLNTK